MRQDVIARVRNRVNRWRSRRFQRRLRPLALPTPLVSFTFDDFPSNAATEGARLLEDAGLRGTFYLAAGLMGRTTPTGLICSPAEVQALHHAGHEIGCHTFDHLDAWTTPPKAFADSIRRNADAIAAFLPGYRLRSFSYPLSEPHPRNKQVAGSAFLACRGGGQIRNRHQVDLHALGSYFLEKARGDLAPVERLVRANSAEPGWLIFSTHDIAPHPTPYGCTPQYFADVIKLVREHGAKVVTVSEACASLDPLHPLAAQA